MDSIRYHRPTDLASAIAGLQAGPQPARVLAGGTDLMVQLRAGHRGAASLISLRDVPGLDRIDDDGGGADAGLRIGARVTLARLADSARAARRAPLLVDAVRRMGHAPMRSRATLVGNLCNASPAADGAGPLLALDAELLVAGPGGARAVPLTELFVGPGQTCLGPAEIATAVRVPRQRGEGRYERLTNRPSGDCALAAVGVLVERDTAGIVARARITLGAVAPVPCRAADAEAALVGRPLDDAAIDAASAAAANAAAAIDDVRCSAWYRTEMVRALTRRGLEALAGADGAR